MVGNAVVRVLHVACLLAKWLIIAEIRRTIREHCLIRTNLIILIALGVYIWLRLPWFRLISTRRLVCLPLLVSRLLVSCVLLVGDVLCGCAFVTGRS